MAEPASPAWRVLRRFRALNRTRRTALPSLAAVRRLHHAAEDEQAGIDRLATCAEHGLDLWMRGKLFGRKQRIHVHGMDVTGTIEASTQEIRESVSQPREVGRPLDRERNDGNAPARARVVVSCGGAPSDTVDEVTAPRNAIAAATARATRVSAGQRACCNAG